MMKKYKVKWDYRSSIGGPYLKGDKIEMEESQAEAINVDSPGVLELVGAKPKAEVSKTETEKTEAEKTGEDEPEAAEKINRMLTQAHERDVQDEHA